MNNNIFIAAVVAVAGVAVACGSNGNSAAPSSPGDASTTSDGAGSDVSVPTADACGVVVKDTDCDQTLRPFVFVHGTYGSGDNFSHVAALLESNGYCPDHIVAVEYNSLGDNPGNDCTAPNTPQGCGKIDLVVNAVLAKFPQFQKVDLAGHSQGTSHCGTYLGAGGVGAHANKVAHYINFSGVPDVGDVQTLSLSSHHDLGGSPHHATGTSICVEDEGAGDAGAPSAPIPTEAGAADDGGEFAAAEAGVPEAGVPEAGVAEAGVAEAGAADAGPACNVIQHTFVNQDHFAVAASKDSFVRVYQYLNGKDPQYTEVQCGDDPVSIAGLSETFADNEPVLGKIEIREVSDVPRAAATADQTLMPDMHGQFSAQLKRNVYYEFAGYDANNTLVGYQYFTPFKRSNLLVRMLSPANKNDGSGIGATIAAVSTDKATRTAGAVTLVARWSGGAFRQDLGASLTVNGSEVLTTDNSGTKALANASLNGGVVGLFMEDANKNGVSDLGLVYSTSFIAFTDVFMDAKTPNLIELSFTPGSEDSANTNNKIVISNWPSSGALVNTFFQ